MDQKLPQHVAIIMDGNGRWAEQRGLSRGEGHRKGVESVKRIVQHCLEKQIPVISLWAFGSENWSRPVEEVNFLMELFLQALQSEVQELDQQQIQLRFTGNRMQLSQELQQQMQAAESLTQSHDRLILNIVINYGGKWDILQAVKTLALAMNAGAIEFEQITEETFSQMLNTNDLPDPDLFIRTSGEQRISNFFLWQLAYTELYFSKLYWPDFSTTEFDEALHFYATRERRYGRTSSQLMQEQSSFPERAALPKEELDYV